MHLMKLGNIDVVTSFIASYWEGSVSNYDAENGDADLGVSWFSSVPRKKSSEM
jgi:hypothetical protein